MIDRIYEELVVTGTQINYLYICRTKLWYFSHNISMEHNSDIVSIGKLINEYSYRRKRKDEVIENRIAIDFIKKGDVIEIHEIKKSPKMEKAHEMQVLYYLYFLKNRGIKNVRAILDYPLMRKRKLLYLTTEKEKEIEKALVEIKKIVNLPTPPTPKRIPRCRKCSYFELCWSD